MGFLGQPVETLLRVNMPNLSRREQVKNNIKQKISDIIEIICFDGYGS